MIDDAHHICKPHFLFTTFTKDPTKKFLMLITFPFHSAATSINDNDCKKKLFKKKTGSAAFLISFAKKNEQNCINCSSTVNFFFCASFINGKAISSVIFMSVHKEPIIERIQYEEPFEMRWRL
jgi:hypothetical protein